MIDVEMVAKEQNKVALENMMNRGNAMMVRRVFALTTEAPSCTDSKKDWLQEQFETLLAGALTEAMDASYHNTLKATIELARDVLENRKSQEDKKNERA